MGNWTKFFVDSFGLEISESDTPSVYAIMERVFHDMVGTGRGAKELHERPRPFVHFGQPDGSTCFPEDEVNLSRNGSYPSGHTIYGWSMALILAEISPERQDPIFARGIDYGYSRVVCGVHWLSDVEAGRTAAAAMVARLHANPEFFDLMAKAKEEVAVLRAK
jgi:acid phosphatase (class A)